MAKNKARDYTRSTIRRLDTLSGNECAYPTCNKRLIAEDGQSIVSKICHIEAASENGPRYNIEMSDDERRGFENLILLCDEHHIIIDNKANESQYPVNLLQQWKRDHEQKMLQLTASKNLLSKNPLALNKVIDAIANHLDDFALPEATKAPSPDEKIAYNGIVRYEPLIREYAVYQGKLNKIYAAIEKEGSTRKLVVLHGIGRVYLDVKKDYPTLASIQQQADAILSKVIDTILDKMAQAPNDLNSLDEETIQFSLMVVIVDAFMRCKILEEPKTGTIQ